MAMVIDPGWIMDTWANDMHFEPKRELSQSEKVAVNALAQIGNQRAIAQLEVNC